MDGLDCRNPKTAFENAIKQGLVPEEWMYMYSTDKRDYFKHRDTREYISYPIGT